MLTKEDIKKKLKDDPMWEPDEDASEEEWELYDEVCMELDEEADGEEPQKTSSEDEEEEDDNDSFDYEESEY